jgi:hypothetical protein
VNIRVLVAMGATLLLLAGLSLRDCEDPTEAAILGGIEDMVQAVEVGDRDRLDQWIAADYGDRLGHQKDSIVRRIMDEVEHYDELDIVLEHLSVKIEENTGFAHVTFMPRFDGYVDASKKKRPKYTFKKGQRLRIKLRKHGPDWLVVRGDMTVSIRGAL